VKRDPAVKDSLLVPMHVIAQNEGDSIVVRWAPGSAVVWLLAQKAGFTFRRRVFRKSDKNVFTLVDSSAVVIHAWPLDTWAAYFKSSGDSLSAIAAQVLYGKTLAFDNDRQGNSLGTIFEKYNEQQNRYGFALLLADFDPAVAEGLGFRFVDRQVQKNLYYLYSVHPAEMRPGMHADTGRVLVSGAEIYSRKKFPDLSSIQGDRVIHLFWPADDPANPYSGYIIERSEDGKHFTRLNRLPFISFNKVKGVRKPVQYNDSVAADYKKYYYRVCGINAFGDRSFPSPVISAMAVDLTPPAPPLITEIKNTGADGKIVFHWEKNNRETDFNGYVVGRSTNLKGPFEPLSTDLLPFDTHDFTDEHPNTNAPNFYMVAAVDTANNAGRSMPAYMNAEDHTPPTQPAGLAGNIDSAGKVTVHWNWNKEDDLAGYKIFFSNAANDIFTPVGAALLTDTLFTDSITLKTLTKSIFYQVIAYDRNMNASPASEILEMHKPDIIPPVAAIIHDFNVSDTAVVLRWFPSTSDDAATQNLYRMEDSISTWKLLSELPVMDTAFTDNTVKPNHYYSYTIETLDSSGLGSGKSFPLNVYVYNKGYTGTIINFKVNKNENNVILSWSAPGGEVNYYILFKGENNKGLKMAGNITGDKLSYEESAAKGSFQYAIKAIYKNGKESAVSEIKTIEVP
jgi:fibronectin type 3 domain-containing protein